MSERIIKFIATFGGLGCSRIAPGTAGSLGGAVIYLLVKGNMAAYAAAFFVLLLLGFATAGRAEEIFHKKDARPIVIDEVCGLLVALFLIPFSYVNLVFVFLIFRTMDVIKPFPIRRLEVLSGSLGIMSDDILAGIYTNLLFRIALKYITF